MNELDGGEAEGPITLMERSTSDIAFEIFRGAILHFLEILVSPAGLIAIAVFVLVALLGIYTRRLTERWDREDRARRTVSQGRRRRR